MLISRPEMFLSSDLTEVCVLYFLLNAACVFVRLLGMFSQAAVY